MWKYRLWFFLFLCTVSNTPATAQEMPHFLEKLSTREGLGSNRVNDITQDDNGFLWIATSDGLNRFDGTEVVQYHHRENSNSLAHNYVHCLEKLPGNYIAIGTQSGLSFFNSTTGIFQNFYYQRNDTTDEFDNIITRLELDDQGNLWVGSKNCIFIFNKNRQLKKVIPSPFTVAEIDKRRQKFVERIFPLTGGHALLYLYNGWQICNAESYSITPLEKSIFKNRLRFLLDPCRQPGNNRPDFFPASNLFKIFGNYFLFISPCNDSLLLYDEQGVVISSCPFPYFRYPYISWSQQLSTLDSTRLLLAFHNYGLAVIPVDWKQKKPAIHSPTEPLFESYEYGNAIKDRSGNWWLATVEEGVQKVSPDKQYFRTESLVRQGESTPIRYSVNTIERYQDKLLIGTYGEGFFEKDLLTGKLIHHDLAVMTNNSWSNFIWNIRQVNADTFWVGTQNGLFWYKLSNKRFGRLPNESGRPAVLDSVAITTQFMDSRGRVWMGLGRAKGVCFYDTKTNRFSWFPGNDPTGYPQRYPLDITEDKKGNLWFINDASVVILKWNPVDARFIPIYMPSIIQKQVGNLHGIWSAGDSIIWMGSITGGLLKFNQEENKFTVFGHDKGLVNSHISNIYGAPNNKLWLVTDGGISCFDIGSASFTNFTANNGLPVELPTSDFYFDALQQRLYNGGKGSYFYFNPDSVVVNHPPQRTVITAMLVNGKLFDRVNGNSKFNSKQNNITIHYTAIDLVNGPASRYAYKLMGEDTGWIMAGNQRQLNFSHLAPGSYKFMVHAANSNGEWSEEAAEISFSIRRPFTKTIIFYALIVAAMAAVFYSMYRFRLRQLMQTEKIRSEISQNLHDEVGSTLTNISLSSLLAQKQVHQDETVNRLLDRIYQDSQQVSEAMREIVWSINPKIDTVGEAIPRMLHYASELLEARNIELRAEVSPDIEKLKLSMQERRDLYLIFKEAVNNLAKHSKATIVDIGLNLRGDTLVMTIVDNGKGFNVSNHFDTNGLKNMQERAGHHKWKLVIQSTAGKGTTLTLNAQIA